MLGLLLLWDGHVLKININDLAQLESYCPSLKSIDSKTHNLLYFKVEDEHFYKLNYHRHKLGILGFDDYINGNVLLFKGQAGYYQNLSNSFLSFFSSEI